MVESISVIHTQSLVNSKTPYSSTRAKVVCTKKSLSILKTCCSNPMAWRIEQISSTALDICKEHTTNRIKCNAKITKYCKVVVAPIFIKIQRLAKFKQIEKNIVLVLP